MSDGESTHQNKWPVRAVVLVGVLSVLGLILFAVRGPSGKTRGPGGKANRPSENYVAQARTLLGKQGDLGSCRAALGMFNSYAQAEDKPAPGLARAESARLRKRLGLNAGELAEVGSTVFTPLDGRHLDSCLLFRSAAKQLEVSDLSGPGGKVARQTPLDRATAGFEWVMRQVRLAPVQEGDESEEAPAAAVVRRGAGLSFQRALVFLALLEQFSVEDGANGLQGCLVFCPNADKRERFWGCGVVVGGRPDAIYLFDPRVGLPVPGPDGKGVATLAQARSNPKVLAQWKAGILPYDVTPEQAASATFEVVVPLSAAAPRMRYLQDTLLRERVLDEQPLPPPVLVRLAEDVDARLSSLRHAVVKSGGKEERGRGVRADGAGLMRRFFPPEEGGSSPGTQADSRWIRFQRNAVPWREYPTAFERNLGVDPRSPLGIQLQVRYAMPFGRALVDPKSPHEELLRGHFQSAVRALVEEQRQMQQARLRLEEAPNVENEVKEWVNMQALPAYAEFIRAGHGGRGRGGRAAGKALAVAPGRPH